MSETLMTFKPGQTLKVLPERIGWSGWMPYEIEVSEVIDHGYVVPGISHRYTIKAADGHAYSGWWFDPNAPTILCDDADDYGASNE